MSGEKERVGFIGVGLMGHGIAKNIVEAGYPLTVMGHRNREPVEDLRKRGAREAETIGELSAGCEIVFLCLPGSPQVEAAVQDILAAKGAVHTIVDCSTSNPVSTRALSDTCKEAGVTLVDAPLARTPKEAWAGQLDTMVGADAADFERLEPLFESWAARIVRVGDVGAGHTVKLLNNFVALGYAALYSEVLVIAAKNGVEATTVRDIINGSRMDCGFFQTFMQYAVDGDRDAHKFTLRNAHKDMRYVTGLANESGIASHLASGVKNSFATAEAIGRGDDFVPMLADVVAELNGVRRTTKDNHA
ncbi:NAD-binding protein [Aliihoeflea aestuarii]|jgi:3-hydroxyisobutyrate dehydrogenase-like beta-hydroxyacid dehydrogenase|uniref:NAD(P)-dependent oxidoreductase n=1 Tax=Aliihoeflea aestuarii TaxID=453840 RepID=UPI00209200D5|nr:NAD(P)-dependent oxidoreductase [Aliihoeflea aestuarii]MCO6390797.1 NAD-binding protein [Aliihoeflea aestuarii]